MPSHSFVRERSGKLYISLSSSKEPKLLAYIANYSTRFCFSTKPGWFVSENNFIDKLLIWFDLLHWWIRVLFSAFNQSESAPAEKNNKFWRNLFSSCFLFSFPFFGIYICVCVWPLTKQPNADPASVPRRRSRSSASGGSTQILLQLAQSARHHRWASYLFLFIYPPPPLKRNYYVEEGGINI